MLLHALRQTPADWEGVVEDLRARLTRRHIAVPPVLAPWVDGLDPAAPHTFTVEGSARALLAALDAAYPDGRRVDLVGLSIGAVTALAAADLAPGRVRSLVLAGGLIHPPQLYTSIERFFATAVTRREAPGQTTRAQVRAAYGELLTLDLRGQMRRVHVPTLVLCGRLDFANLPQAWHMTSLNRRARLRLIPGAGHLFNVSHPEDMGRIVARHLAEVAAFDG